MDFIDATGAKHGAPVALAADQQHIRYQLFDMEAGSAAAELMDACSIVDKKVRALLSQLGKHGVAAHSAPRNVWAVAQMLFRGSARQRRGAREADAVQTAAHRLL